MAAASFVSAQSALVTLLRAALVGTGLPVQAVYDDDESDFEQQSPVVSVQFIGLQRVAIRIGTQEWDTNFLFAVTVWVAAPEPNNANWTDQDVRTVHSVVEVLIANVVTANRRNAAWRFLTYAPEFSVMEDGQNEGGKSYRKHVIALVAKDP